MEYKFEEIDYSILEKDLKKQNWDKILKGKPTILKQIKEYIDNTKDLERKHKEYFALELTAKLIDEEMMLFNIEITPGNMDYIIYNSSCWNSYLAKDIRENKLTFKEALKKFEEGIDSIEYCWEKEYSNIDF